MKLCDSQQQVLSLVEQAIGCLTEAGTGKQYDSSWIRPRTMTRQEIQTACEQAYHLMHKVKEALEANEKCANSNKG